MRRACFNINLLGNVLGIALCLSLQPSNHTAVQAAQAQSQPCLSAALWGLPCHRQGPHGRIPLGSIGRPSRVPQGCAGLSDSLCLPWSPAFCLQGGAAAGCVSGKAGSCGRASARGGKAWAGFSGSSPYFCCALLLGKKKQSITRSRKGDGWDLR